MMVVLYTFFSLSVSRNILGHDGDVSSHGRPSSFDLSSVNLSFAAFNYHDNENDNMFRRRVNELRAGTGEI